jgi:hypothetical protein
MRIGLLVLLGLLLMYGTGFPRPIVHSFCLDAGHGGSDGGTQNQGIHEADVALDCLWAVLGEIEFTGYNPDSAYFTRIDDVNVSVADRYRIANGLKKDPYDRQAPWPVRYFLSLHLNSGGTTAHGSCVLVYQENGQTKCSTGGCIEGDANCPINAPEVNTASFKLALDVINTIGGSDTCCAVGWQFGAFEQCDGGFLGRALGGYVPPRDGILGRNSSIGILYYSQAYATVLVETEFLSNDQFALNVLKPAYYYTWCYEMGGAIADGLECFSDKDDPSGSGPGRRDRVVLWPVTARGD